MANYYLSKNYKGLGSAGNKAKTDAEQIMENMGFCNAGLRRTTYENSILGFLVTLLGVLKVPFTVSKGDLLVLQYPLKKYYTLVCLLAHIRGCKVITLIHDLGTFRRKKLTAAKEIKRLSHSDYLIAHNECMKSWLLEHGYSNPVGCLAIFDYLSETTAASQKQPKNPYHVIYAGGLSYRKNRFLYEIDSFIHGWHFNLYGGGFELDRIEHKEHFTYKGFVPSDELIATADGDFGLVWDGESASTCTGAFGEYLQYNNPHKTSLYIRCHLPVIIWKKAALASFITENQMGISIDSLTELDQLLPSITPDKYALMKQNTIKMDRRLASGYYFTHAFEEAEHCLRQKRR